MKMKPNCEVCNVTLSHESDAFVCSYECTFCQNCTDRMRGICPNCSGELVPRPKRKMVSRSFVIAQGNFDHLEAIAKLFDEYRQFYGQASDLDGARRFLRDCISNQESVLFLAIAAEGALGFVQLFPSFTSVGMKRGWILNDLFVKESGRRRGVAFALMERAKVFAQGMGAVWLKLETAKSNHAAQGLYRKMGFVSEVECEYYTLVL